MSYEVKLLASRSGYFWARIIDGPFSGFIVIARVAAPRTGKGRHRRKWWCR